LLSTYSGEEDLIISVGRLEGAKGQQKLKRGSGEGVTNETGLQRDDQGLSRGILLRKAGRYPFLLGI
jgi:hypothetical protein